MFKITFYVKKLRKKTTLILSNILMKLVILGLPANLVVLLIHRNLSTEVTHK
jgi:hypothetical protein